MSAEPPQSGRPEQARDAGSRDDQEQLAVLTGVTKRFGDALVLDQVSLSIAPREIVVVMGASGCGKTTLLRVIAGLEDPEGGEIFLDGEAAFRDGERVASARTQHTVGMVFQQYALWPHLNVRANLSLAPRTVLKLDAKETAERARSALLEVSMEGHLNSRPNRLSGGERQRVAIARALMMRPRLLLCDEITSALDPPVSREILGTLNRLRSEDGISCLIVTHDVGFALRAADRLIYMKDGQVVEELRTEVSRTPSTEAFRSFIEASR